MTLQELEKRVRVLEDIEEIKQMHRAYIYCLSACQWEKMADFFAEDGIAHIARHNVAGNYDSAKGREQIRTMLTDGIGKRWATLRPMGGHLLIQPVISVDGDTARGYWLLSRFTYDNYDLRLPGKPVAHLDRGRYEAEYVREKGAWKFSRLEWTCPWPVPEKSA